MALTKRKLTKKIAGDVGCNQEKASEILLVILESIQSTLLKEGSFSISKFGKFYLTTLNPREIKHPVTGERIKVGKRNVIRFKPYKSLGEAVNHFEWSCADPYNQKILQAIYDLIEDAEIEDKDEDEMMYYPGKLCLSNALEPESNASHQIIRPIPC
jgi:nucleoid DNA-binding protein